MELTVLLPSYKEQASIIQTIQDVKEHAPEARIIVVDSYSPDDTVKLAQQAGAEIILVMGRGKGRAVKYALDTVKSDYYIMMDSDYTYPAKHIPEIARSLKSGYDVVMGYRKYRESGSMPLIKALGNNALSILASIRYRVAVIDLCTGMWGFSKNAVECLKLTSIGFTLEADLFKNAVRNHLKIMQIPIEYRARLKGSDTKLNIGHGVEIAKFILKG